MLSTSAPQVRKQDGEQLEAQVLALVGGREQVALHHRGPECLQLPRPCRLRRRLPTRNLCMLPPKCESWSMAWHYLLALPASDADAHCRFPATLSNDTAISHEVKG
jgi:hypothetical protein